MTSEAACCVYLIPAPLEKASKLLRRALADAGLAVMAEVDLSESLRRLLRIEIASCRLFLVYCPVPLLQTLALHPSAAVFLPLHLVLAGRGASAEAHVLNPRLWYEVLGPDETSEVFRAQLNPLLECLHKMATRQGTLEHVHA